MASSLICWSATAECTAPEAEYICPVGFLHGWSVGVELVAGLPERPSSHQRHFLQAPKDVSVRCILTHTTHSRLYGDALYKSTFYLLPYYLNDMKCHCGAE